ncbi:DMT family transporter [Brenneria corticis]|uniref:EamA/RhaT family transporter n=1 Tax=Brenneria corticis TaxID=2173106 RepID=A0A2U1TYT1_9GAMM|nr:DMT family transporter [Brenneria sp. CFCC 11842]PWC14567.1 EamA/RhaT family transporter [Brenneria sp. CFCC 11842]
MLKTTGTAESEQQKGLIGIAMIVAALQILPFSDIMAKYLSLSITIIQVIWGRFFFHCIITGIYSAVAYGPRYLAPNLSAMLLLRSTSLFAAVGLFYVTIHYLPLTTSLTLWFVEPFILTLMAALILKEKVTAYQWLAIFIGFVGIVIAIRPTIVEWHWAYIVGLLAGFFYALFLFFTRFIDNKIPSVVSVYHTGLVGGVLASVTVAPYWVAPTPSQWLLLVGCGAIAAIAHLLIIKSFELANASTIAPFTYSEIIMGAILGFIVFADAPDIWLFIGLAIVVGSGIALTKIKQSLPKSSAVNGS